MRLHLEINWNQTLLEMPVTSGNRQLTEKWNCADSAYVNQKRKWMNCENVEICAPDTLGQIEIICIILWK